MQYPAKISAYDIDISVDSDTHVVASKVFNAFLASM